MNHTMDEEPIYRRESYAGRKVSLEPQPEPIYRRESYIEKKVSSVYEERRIS